MRGEKVGASLLANLDDLRRAAFRPRIRDGRHSGRHRVQEGEKNDEAGEQLPSKQLLAAE